MLLGSRMTDLKLQKMVHQFLLRSRNVFASEGDTVTLDCKVETTDTTLYLFWYRQEMGDFPKYLWKSYVGISENAPGISGERFKATTNGTSVPLKIQKLQLTDSAGTSDRTTQHQLKLVLPLQHLTSVNVGELTMASS
uniref:Immunoglobulin V-set domain-containing protein n=1 Tax=Labrus bergylta TaxID=56723 RepID=A0A3Q3E4S0_9LABR